MNFDKPMQFEEALRFARQKKLLPTTLSSAELEALDAGIKQRSFFSARVTLLDFLDEAADLTTKIVGGPDEEDFALRAQGKKPLLMSIPDAKAQLKKTLDRFGYRALPGEEGTLKDLASDGRLSLVVETNVADMRGYGQWKVGQDYLGPLPALELVRARFSKVPRDWVERWIAARAATTEEGSTDGTGRLVALKNHPIWQALGDGAGGYRDTLGNPWFPFAFNSGMITIDVLRRDAVALGLMNPTTQIPKAEDIGMNDNLQASGKGYSEAIQKTLAENPYLELKDGVLRMKPTRTEPIANSLIRNRIAGVLELIANSNPNHDAQGRFATSAQKKEVRKGRAAVKRVMRREADEPAAIHVVGVGDVDFKYGRPGTWKANERGATHADGYGLSHIHAKHGTRAVLNMPEVLVKGVKTEHAGSPGKILVEHSIGTAVLERTSRSSGYVVTSFDPHAPKLRKVDVKAREIVNSKAGLPLVFGARSTGFYEEDGSWVAGPGPTQAEVMKGHNRLVASKVSSVAHFRSNLKSILSTLEAAA